MSIAGIRSNRGDDYQTLKAFDWALKILSNPDLIWIEIDSVSYAVDDIVIGKSDGSVICCQCKKNQAHFNSWSINDFADELAKASQVLTQTPNAQIRFYSRDSFGKVAKLCEYSRSYESEDLYFSNLTQEHKKTNEDLANCFATEACELSTYNFLRRTHFEVTPDFDALEEQLRSSLRQLVSNSNTAFDILWRCLSRLGGRMQTDEDSFSSSIKHRLTKEDLQDILQKSGVLIVPSILTTQVIKSFAITSAIGRSWHRDISGHQISSSLVNELLAAIENKKSSVLLIGTPGSGKTCVLLSLQEALEQRMKNQGDLVSLFIQSREFVDSETAQERQTQGLSSQWVEEAARLADETQVVVIIDSLDVLSIAREHNALTYFLAQIDRLQLIPNVTLITACREFDRKYDRRIAAREWDQELSCQQLDWSTEIEPLLRELNIDANAIDTVTREIINNPRALSLFVDLVQHSKNESNFNVVNSQALTQRYLKTIVQEDIELGDVATEAIEELANMMLETRSLSVPRQRFSAPQDILRRLCSLNVLQENHNQQLTFGHQTLLDVLVVSNAIRRGLTLNEFIQDLKPVPFVRPSIRSFVEQLATGDRRTFRKQVRTVLTGNSAFHIRRLVAECFSEQIPEDSDWSLIQELRNNYPEVFQVIYTQASLVEWHHFWLTNLVPMLKMMNDADGLMAHINLVERWKHEDAAGVISFWIDMFELGWLEGDRIANRLAFYIREFKTETLHLIPPLLDRILSSPFAEHSFLGNIIAHCVVNGFIDDVMLWHYIAGEINEEDITGLNISNKLHCHPDEFGNRSEDFLKKRILESIVLLDLVINDIERWSKIISIRYSREDIAYYDGYLRYTSFSTKRSQTDHEYINEIRILLDTIEAAILHHAEQNSDWWQKNKTRLCFSNEGSFKYFAILALTKFPENNLNEISDLLCNKKLLESKLSYELGELIKVSFVHLDIDIQNKSTGIIKAIFHEYLDEENQSWILKKQAEYVSAIPCYLRSAEIQSILDNYSNKYGVLIRQPSIDLECGFVSSPFSYEVLFSISDDSLIRLLQHYNEYDDRNRRDFLVGGKREVGFQLREASSRHPSRFLRLLNVYFPNILTGFRDDIMEGVANHLAYRFGNRSTNNSWRPLEEPEAHTLVNQVFNHLERYLDYWLLNSSAAQAIRACSHIIQDTQSADRLVFLVVGFKRLSETSTMTTSGGDLITTAINMTSGNITEALMVLANRLQEYCIEFPELLEPTLKSFASNENPEIRALMLQYLPYLQSQNPELGWELFHLVLDDSNGLWQYAERCLFYGYRNHFETVAPLIERIRHEGNARDLETWGRISALATLAGHISLDELLSDLETLDTSEAWKGATSVWSHPENIKKYRFQCLQGMEVGLRIDSSHIAVVTQNMSKIFRDDSSSISLPENLIQLYFNACKNSNSHDHYFFGGWLNKISQQDPELALTGTEIFLEYIGNNAFRHHDYEDQLVQLLKILFAEAEEREESDEGVMLKRVVSVQDSMLSLGINSIDNWLKSAERP